jgi:protein-tyrosine phosphatase
MRIAAERRDINILSKARQINSKDFDEFNYILAMDDSNFKNIQDLKNRTASTGFAAIKKNTRF